MEWKQTVISGMRPESTHINAIRYDTMHMPCYVVNECGTHSWCVSQKAAANNYSIIIFLMRHKIVMQSISLRFIFRCVFVLFVLDFGCTIRYLSGPFLSSGCFLTLICLNINYSAKQINSFRVHKYCEQTLVTNYGLPQQWKGAAVCVNVEPWHLLSHNWFILSMYFPDYQSFIYAWEWCTNNSHSCAHTYTKKMSLTVCVRACEREKESILWILCSSSTIENICIFAWPCRLHRDFMLPKLLCVATLHKRETQHLVCAKE